MQAVVFKDVGKIAMEDVPEPGIQDPTDAIVRITSSAICGTDLHMIRGSMGPMEPGTIMGHEGVGIVEAVGPGVRNLREGDRVVIPSTIACGYCSYCRAGYHAQCDNANPNGPRAGTAFFGGPKSTGAFHGLQAQKARIPFANAGPVKLPDSVTDKMAICLSDILPTGYFGAVLAEVTPGDTVAVFGCGPVGQFAILSARLMDAGRIIAVDQKPSRLDMAAKLGAEVIDFSREEPVETILQLTGGIGVDRVIDAVGVDAELPTGGPAAQKLEQRKAEYERELEQVAPQRHPQGAHWHPGNAPSLALHWEVEALAKAGTLGIIGVYPQTVEHFPVGMAMNKNLTVNMGNCNHRRYIPELLELVRGGMVETAGIITQVVPLTSAVEAYEMFDSREMDWVKVEVVPQPA